VGCYSPRRMLQKRNVENVTDTNPLVFAVPKNALKHDYVDIDVSCGKCNGCKATRAGATKTLILAEAHMHDENCALLLTYDVENLPENGNLVPDHAKTFFDSLRKQVWRKHKKRIKYKLIGEYGGATHRPHYHFIIFNYQPNDLILYQQSSQKSEQSEQHTSKIITDLWPYGTSYVATLDGPTVGYIAGHGNNKIRTIRQKKLHESRMRIIDVYTGECTHRIKEFSSGTPLGKSYYERYGPDEFYNRDQVCIESGKNPVGVPRRFDDLLQKTDPQLLKQIKQNRHENGENSTKRDMQNRSINTELRAVGLPGEKQDTYFRYKRKFAEVKLSQLKKENL